jgi:hypothetical protein
MQYVCRCPCGHELVDEFGEGSTPSARSFFCPACGVPVEVQRAESLDDLLRRAAPTVATEGESQTGSPAALQGATVEALSPSAMVGK